MINRSFSSFFFNSVSSLRAKLLSQQSDQGLRKKAKVSWTAFLPVFLCVYVSNSLSLSLSLSVCVCFSLFLFFFAFLA